MLAKFLHYECIVVMLPGVIHTPEYNSKDVDFVGQESILLNGSLLSSKTWKP